MASERMQRVMLAVTALAIVAGVVVAIVTTPNSDGPLSPPATHGVSLRRDEHSSDLARAAHYIGVSPAQLRRELNFNSTLAEIADATTGRSASGLLQALLAPRAAHLDKAVFVGKLSKTQQTSRLNKLSRRLSEEIHRHQGITVGPVDRATAARYLGLTVEQIRTALRSGRSLAQIANSTRGHSAAALTEALTRAKTVALAAAVRTGKLSHAEQRTSIATLSRRVSAEVYFVPRKRARRSG